MAFALLSIPKRIYKTLASLRTGVVLLILVVIASALGTFVLQRPVTEPDKLQAAYSPQALRWLDRLTLTDIFHSWWFLTLLGAGQPKHHLRIHRTFSERVALLRASLSEDGFSLSLCQPIPA